MGDRERPPTEIPSIQVTKPPLRQQLWLPRVAALASAVVGLINIASALTPDIRWRGHLLLSFEPVETIRLFHAMALPFGTALVDSLQHGPLHPGAGQFTLRNYRRFLGDGYYWIVVARTFGLGLVVAAICIVLGYP